MRAVANVPVLDFLLDGLLGARAAGDWIAFADLAMILADELGIVAAVTEQATYRTRREDLAPCPN